MKWCFLVSVGMWIIGAACIYTSKKIPHRPVDVLTNWAQGKMLSTYCPPETLRVETEDGLFLECLSLSHYYRGSP